jgi:hypothetical protein
MAGKERGEVAVLTTLQLFDRGRADPDGQPGVISARAGDHTSRLGIYASNRVYNSFSIKYYINMSIL